jgi:hypothetical protein
LDRDSDRDERLDGALLIAVAMDDIALLRQAWMKRDGE